MLSQFTQTMRASESDSELFEECPGRETFDQMLSDAIAHEMSKSGAMGLNKLIYRAMGGTYEKSPQRRVRPGPQPKPAQSSTLKRLSEKMPDNPLERLLINLQTAHKVYQRLLELAERKRPHIVQNDLEALRRDIESEQRLAAAGASLNTEREAPAPRVLRGAARQSRRQSAPGRRGQARGPVRGHAPGNGPAFFAPSARRCCRTLEQLLRANRANAFLVNNSLDLMQGLLNALFGGEKICAYGPRGVPRPDRIFRALSGHPGIGRRLWRTRA